MNNTLEKLINMIPDLFEKIMSRLQKNESGQDESDNITSP